MSPLAQGMREIQCCLPLGAGPKGFRRPQSRDMINKLDLGMGVGVRLRTDDCEFEAPSMDLAVPILSSISRCC